VIRIKKIVLNFLFLFSCVIAYGQGASLSPHDLMENYFEKKNAFRQVGQKEITDQNQKELTRIVTVLEENAPNSYEYHLVKYSNGNYDLKFEKNLFQAYELKPDEKRVQEEMFAYYVLTNNSSKQKELALKLKRKYSQNALSYYTELGRNPSIKNLFLSGSGDAYPFLVLQSVGAISNKINAINLDFITNEMYCKRMAKKIGLEKSTKELNAKNFLNEAIKMNQNGLFISTTINQAYFSKQASNLYLNGLTYSTNNNSQYNDLMQFWKSVQLKLTQVKLKSQKERNLYRNYLPPLLTLYKFSCLDGQKDEVLKKGILLLAEEVGKKKLITEIIATYERTE